MMKNHGLRSIACGLLIVFSAQTAVAEIRFHGIQVQAGTNYPGIIDDTPDGVDGTSSASRWGVSAGIHPRFEWGKNILETGLDVHSGTQRFENDATGEYLDTDWLEIAVPLTYNFCLFSRGEKGALLEIKLGIAPGYFLPLNTEYSESTGKPEFQRFFVAPLLGIQLTPICYGPCRVGIGASTFRSFTKVLDDKVFADEYGILSHFSAYLSLDYVF